MAAPAEKTLKNLNGSWTLNKSLSDSSEPVLALQGIGYFIRKGISIATITLSVNQYEAAPKPPNTAAAADKVWHVDIEQSASGLSSTQERRCLDDFPREHSDWLFGAVRGRTRWVALAEVDDEFLKGNWEAEGEDLILSVVESQGNGWVARQVWGFQKVEGERRYCRNIVVTKGSERVAIRLVYDYNA